MNKRSVTRIFLAIAILGLVAAGVYASYRLGQSQGSPAIDPATAAAGSAPAGALGSEKGKILYWHDPMLPGLKFDKPGMSPMNMPLVPVYAETGAGGDRGVTVSARAQENFGMRTAAVVVGALAPRIEVVGNVGWNEHDVAVVTARAAGYVEKLYVRAPLDLVKKGQPLAALYVPDWVAAQEEFLAVRRMAAQAGASSGMKSLVGGALQRMRLAGMSEAQIAGVERAGVVQLRIALTAPIAGVIAELGVREGASVAAGMPIARINGLATVWINADLPEALAAQVQPGSVVEGRTAAGSVVRGKVGALLPDINPVTRTLKVRVEADNADGRLLPGMFATLRFAPVAQRDVLLIPSEALIATGKRTVVMVATDNGGYMPVEVETGLEANGQTEIRKGLRAGQRVVLSGQFLIDSEASLRGVEARLGTGENADAKTKGNVANAAAGAATQRYRGKGRVDALGNGSVTLSHGPIAGINWPAMTMQFAAPQGGVPRNVAVGDTVEFEFRQTPDGAPQLTAITPVVPARRPGAPTEPRADTPANPAPGGRP